MKKQKDFSANTLWWLDTHIINTSILKFKFNKTNNLYYVNLTNAFYYYFFLLNKNNSNTLFFSNLDAVILKNTTSNYYYITTQTMFSDFKIIIYTKFNDYLQSISQVFPGNTWIERELREFNENTFLNLVDTRKLLSNYSYETNLNYVHFNEIINDICA